MQNVLAVLAISALVAWTAILLLPWGPWRTREVLESLYPLQADASPGVGTAAPSGVDLSDVTVVIPARDEAALIPGTFGALKAQGGGLQVVLVDDCSRDGTAAAARAAAGSELIVINGQPLPQGWAGKLWALEQGVRRVSTRYTLLLDADIRLAPGVVEMLHRLAQERRRPFVSIMASLPMQRFWEKLLTPAFIYFFKMLYPFALANGPNRRFASAAGGCILLETRLFTEIGGLESMRGALIDDCTLAARLKSKGIRTWTGQSHLVTSARGYRNLGEIWNMIARSAYTQLMFSPLLLLLTTLGLIVLFAGPLLGLLSPNPFVRAAGLAAFLAMACSYLPTLLFYRRSPFWALLMPLIGFLYLAMTWTSAIRYVRGTRSQWKGREYRADYFRINGR